MAPRPDTDAVPFVTTEVRWFVPGPLPRTWSQWFAARARHAVEEPPRTDFYLRTGCDEVGIKLRGGRLEVKGLQASSGIACVVPHASGEVQRWSKWWAPDPGFGDMAERQASGHGSAADNRNSGKQWIEVTKTRTVARLGVGPEGTVLAQPGPGAGQDGDLPCQVEIAAVETVAGPCWTLAFEASAASDAGHAALQAACRHILAAGTPDALRASDSLSYPAWLARRIALRV